MVHFQFWSIFQNTYWYWYTTPIQEVTSAWVISSLFPVGTNCISSPKSALVTVLRISESDRKQTQTSIGSHSPWIPGQRTASSRQITIIMIQQQLNRNSLHKLVLSKVLRCAHSLKWGSTDLEYYQWNNFILKPLFFFLKRQKERYKKKQHRKLLSHQTLLKPDDNQPVSSTLERKGTQRMWCEA